jgi:hypothetical protein
VVIKKVSILTGNVNEMDIPISHSQYLYWQRHGGLVSKTFPHCSDEQHEFLRSGITPEERDHHHYNGRHY